MADLRRLGPIIIATGGSTPGFCCTRTGVLIVSYRDTVEGDNDGLSCVSITRSLDDGLTWETPRVVAGSGATAGRAYLSHVGINCLSDGTVLLPYRDLCHAQRGTRGSLLSEGRPVLK